MMQSSTLQISNRGSKAFAMDIRTDRVMVNFSYVLLTRVEENMGSILIWFSAVLYLVENILQSAWGVFVWGLGGGVQCPSSLLGYLSGFPEDVSLISWWDSNFLSDCCFWLNVTEMSGLFKLFSREIECWVHIRLAFTTWTLRTCTCMNSYCMNSRDTERHDDNSNAAMPILSI